MKKSLQKRILLLVSMSLLQAAPVSSYSNPELAKIDKFIDAGRFGQARDIIKKLINSKNPSPEALEFYPIAIFFDNASVMDTRAFACARDAARMNPKNAHIMATYALVLCELKKYEDGIKIVNRAIALDPKDGRSHAIAAYLYKKVEDTPAANSQMEEALRLDSKSRDVNYLAAKFYWEEIEGNKVEECYKRWLKNQPNSALAHYKTALYYRDLRRNEEAISECKKAIALNNEFMLARGLWQGILLKQKRYKEAAELITTFMKISFQSFVTYSDRAECYANTNEPQKAIDDYTKAIDLRTPAIAKVGLVEAAKKMDKPQKKDQLSWWVARSQQYSKIQKHKQAIDDLNLLIAAFPTSPSIVYARAKAFDAAKKYPEALKDADTLIAHDPDVTQWYRFKAEILKKMGRAAEAKDYLKRADSVESSGKSPTGRGIL
ncbi:MAG: tetratricopeptide repeat protein [Cyanobacteria bacterium TGS_CYA1]|nr:tetratricopeptide repeat protein [Cyanobacteria bacterium TGS_CYA1]